MGQISNEPRKIDFAGIEAVLRGVVPDYGLIREPLKCTLSTNDLKRVLIRFGELKCAPKKFVVDADNKFVYENLFKWAIGDSSLLALNPMTGEVERGSLTKGIYLCGPTGTGKTACLNIFRGFLNSIGAMITINGRGRYMLAWQNYFATDVSQMMQDYGSVAWSNEYPSLCIQDIGSEIQTVSHFGTKSNALEQVLQMRGESNLITILSSNYKIKGIPYGPRIESRLCQMCNYYELKGKDRRMM